MNVHVGRATLPSGAVGRWLSRGYVPHFDSSDVVQHVTYHLADSLPVTVLARFEDELRSYPRNRQDAERRKRVENWIDAGYGSCALRDPAIAQLVEESFLRFDGERYRLLSWVVMPNHVHVLFQSLDPWTMPRIVASWKSFTGRRISVDGGRVWQREYWDRYIRNERHFKATVEYIHSNPVKAKLVRRPGDWRWSSASALRHAPS